MMICVNWKQLYAHFYFKNQCIKHFWYHCNRVIPRIRIFRFPVSVYFLHGTWWIRFVFPESLCPYVAFNFDFCCNMGDKSLQIDGDVHELKLGKSFDPRSNVAFHSFRCKFDMFNSYSAFSFWLFQFLNFYFLLITLNIELQTEPYINIQLSYQTYLVLKAD